MAYCRFGESDIYLYPSVDGGVDCCACRLARKVPTIWTKGSELWGVKGCSACGGEGCDACMMHDNTAGMTYVEAIEHVERHVAAGHDVPSDVVEALKRDRAEEGE